MRARTSLLWWTLGIAALLLCQRHAAALEVKVDGGALKVAGGTVELAADPAKGAVSVRSGNLTLSGKGALLKLSRGQDGKTAVTDLSKAAGAGELVEVSDSDLLVARVEFAPSLTAAALWNPGGAPATLPVPLAALGFPDDAVLAGFDLAEDEFFGPVFGALARRVNGGQCGLFALGQAGDRPVLLCTSRTGSGPDDLAKLAWDPKANVLSGTSGVEKGQRYELRLLAPPEPVRWVAEAATASAADQQAGVRTMVMQTNQWLRIYIESPEARTVAWQVAFSRKPPKEVAAGQVHFSAKALSGRRVALACYGIPGEVVIRRSDGAEFVTGSGTFQDTTASPDTAYTYELHPLSWAGRKPAVATAQAKTPALPPLPPLPNVYLSDLKPTKAENGWNGEPRRDKSIEENPLSIRGDVFKRGMGVHALAELEYALRPEYKRFVAVVGVDDEKNDTPSGTVTFEVYADDKPLYKSKVLTPFDERVGIDVALPEGAKQIRLVVGDGGDGVGCDHADWANAGFVTE